MQRIRRICALVWIVGMFGAAEAWSAGLLVENGILMGATNVDVNGTLYTVEFVDGSCGTVYGDCRSPSDFPFSNSEVNAATQALLDQVLLDVPEGSFDSTPELTAGCTSSTLCQIAISIEVFNWQFCDECFVTNAFAANFPTLEDRTGRTGFAFFDYTDTSDISNFVYSRWTEAPEPGTALLSAFGLVGLTLVSRRNRPGAR